MRLDVIRHQFYVLPATKLKVFSAESLQGDSLHAHVLTNSESAISLVFAFHVVFVLCSSQKKQGMRTTFD